MWAPYARRTDADNAQREIRARGGGGDENGRHGPSVYVRGRQRQARSIGSVVDGMLTNAGHEVTLIDRLSQRLQQ